MKVSVIVPVYNCGRFLGDFLECLQGQTMREFEAIFIDDCSSDNTTTLLQQTVKQDSRLVYYRNEDRRGAAYSRNRGIEMSHAPYILCLDADDRYECDLLEQVVKAAYENDADMVMLERNDFYGTDISTINRERYLFEDERIVYKKKIFSAKEQPADFFLRCENGTCDRMVRKSLLDKYEIRFQNLKNSNDVFYILFSTFCAQKIVHTDTYDNLYHRRVHTEPGRISNSRDPMCALKALLQVHNSLVKYDLWKEYCVYFWIFALDSIEKQLFVCKDEMRKKEVYEYIQKEGLFQIGIKTDNQFERLPKAFKAQYDKFLILPYEKKCFLNSMVMEAVCQLYSWKLKALATKMSGKRLGFWGAGRTTKVFINAYRAQGGKIAQIIDNDLKKQGTDVAECRVIAFEESWRKTDAIIISNRHYYSAIRRQILEKSDKIEILSLEEIIYS